MNKTKLMALVLAVVMAFTMTACNNSKDTNRFEVNSSNSEIIEVTDTENNASENVDNSEIITPVESEKPAADPSSKPTSTSTPEIKPEGNTKPETKPNESPKQTPTPEVAKCGVVGHTSDGKCPACGNIYTAPVVTPTQTPKPTSVPAVTCPTCGSTEHAKHPVFDDNDKIPIAPDPGDGDGDNPEWENDPPCPVCGSYEHTTHPTPPPVATCGKCGGTGHNASAHCGWCNGINCTSTHCPTCGSTAHAQHPAPDVNREHDVEIKPGDGEGDNPIIGK